MKQATLPKRQLMKESFLHRSTNPKKSLIKLVIYVNVCLELFMSGYPCESLK